MNNTTRFTIIFPDFEIKTIDYDSMLTIANAVPKCVASDCDQTIHELLVNGRTTVSWEACAGELHDSTIIMSLKSAAKPCVLEITMLDGSTRFASVPGASSIRDALTSLNFHPLFSEKPHAIHNGHVVPLHQKIDALDALHVRLACFPLRGGGGKGNEKSEGKKGKPAIDPLSINDPWAASASSKCLPMGSTQSRQRPPGV